LSDGGDYHEWLAAITVDFFNELPLLYGLVLDEGVGASKYKKAGEGFPPGFEYRWATALKLLLEYQHQTT